MAATLKLFGVVGTDFTAATVTDWLDAHDRHKAIDIRVNSPGGSVIEGSAIHNAIDRFPGKVTAHIDGAALSAASYIVMAADRIIMASNAVLMIHDPAVTQTAGGSAQLRKEADVLDQMRDNLTEAYSARTGISADEINKMLAAETWLSAKEAVELGFADAIAQRTKQVAQLGSYEAPHRFAALLQTREKNMDEKDPEEIIEQLRARIAELEAELEGAKEAPPEGDPAALAKHAAFFAAHPDFFVRSLTKGETVAAAKDAYAAHLLEENKRLKERHDALTGGVEPVALGPGLGFSNGSDSPDPIAYEAEWKGNRQLRREFNNDFDSYAAYRSAEDRGLVSGATSRKPQ